MARMWNTARMRGLTPAAAAADSWAARVLFLLWELWALCASAVQGAFGLAPGLRRR